jgi:DNA-binding MarR family transcriptional regulator
MTKKTQQSFDISELQDLLSLFKQTFSELYKKETRNLHCSMSHLEIMQYIADHGNPTMKDIAGYLKITPPSVTTLIDTMVENALVKREVATGDRRTVRVRLTPKAVTLYKNLQKKKTHLLTILLKKLTTEQKHQLSEIIRTLVK